MDILTSSGSSVTVATAATAGKAVGTWATQRPFGGVDNGSFAALMGTVGRGGQVRRSHRHYCARMGVVDRVLVGSKRGGEKKCPQCWCR